MHPSNLALYEDDDKVCSRAIEDRLFQKYKSKNPEDIVEKMVNEVNLVSAQYIKLWHAYLDLFKISPRFCFAALEEEYLAKQREFWKKLMVVNRFTVKELTSNISFNEAMQEQQLLEEKLKVQPNFRMLDDNLVSKRENIPVLIHNVYDLEKESKIMTMES